MPAASGGAACPVPVGEVQTQDCNPDPCTVNCQGAWGAWGGCSSECGGGTRTRVFTVTQPAENGGLATTCAAADQAAGQEACNAQACGAAAADADCAGGWSLMPTTLVPLA